MTTFTAVWPIIDPGMPAAELFEEARNDLPAVAARHRARLIGEPRFAVRSGRGVPGSQGAAHIVTATVPAEEITRREYGRLSLTGAAA